MIIKLYKNFCLLLLSILFISFSCQSDNGNTKKPHKDKIKVVKAVNYNYEIVEELPHDSTIFTQGLFIDDGKIYESGGMRGYSRLEIRDLQTQQVIKKREFDRNIFAEGICKVDNSIYMLTYTSGKCMVFDINTLEPEKSYSYIGEGWGIEYNGENIYMSDGSSYLKVINDKTYTIDSTLQVKMDGSPIDFINELEFAKGKLYANIWGNERVVEIDPHTGNVTGYLDLFELKSRLNYNPAIDVMNGIAYNKEEDLFYLTGKMWPKMFKVKFITN